VHVASPHWVVIPISLPKFKRNQDIEEKYRKEDFLHNVSCGVPLNSSTWKLP
jgi:hypothetical protein